MRYVYGITAAILLGGAAATLSLNPVGAQTAQNAPGTIAAAPPAGAPMSFANLAERLQPAVVNISTRQSVTVQRRQLPPGFEEFFRRFGGDQNQQQDEGPVTQRGGSLGSGFIISADGYIVTNNHVVAPARADAVVEQITVTLADRTEYEAEVVGRDVASDIALLKVTPTRPLPFVQFGDSTRTRVGDWVVAIGNPFGLGGTVTAGIVSALHRNLPGGGLYDRYIQTDTAINSGNSGGPMFDLNGNVIGINTALISPTGGNVGIGFAIPAEQIRPVVETLRRGEHVRRGYIGVGMQDIDEGVAAALGIPRNRGVLIRSVTPGGPAARAGIEQGDVVVTVAGEAVTPDQTLAYIVAQQAIGARVPVELIRQGQRRNVTIAIAERPSEEELARLGGGDEQAPAAEPGGGKPTEEAQSTGQRSTQQSLGLAVQALTPALAQQLRLRDANVRGLVIGSVDPNSDAGQKGLQVGDIILSIDQVATPTPEAAAAALDAARRARRNTVLLQVKRGNNPPLYVGVDLARQ